MASQCSNIQEKEKKRSVQCAGCETEHQVDHLGLKCPRNH